MNVNFKKSKIPIIWLDTFAIIRFAKIVNGESLPLTEQERYVKLLELLNRKLKEKKLICVKSEQIEEIKLGRRLIKECDDIITRLSVGSHIQPPYGIEQFQLYTFMNAYYHSLEEVELDYKTAFFRDPIAELLSDKKFIISIKEKTDEESIKEIEERKNKLIVEFESLRLDRINNGIAFEEQLELERQGIIEAIKIYLSQEKSEFDLNEYMALIGDALSCWKRISGRANDLEGLFGFYKSEYYRKMPYNDIKAKLYARIITDQNPIETGDSIDVVNIASMAPYCNMVLTDKKMRNRIYDLSIHTDYDVKIFALKDYDELMDYIQAI